MYPDTRVSQFVNEHFVPVRVHVRQQSDEFKRLGERFGAQWTPTTLLVDPAGQERHRIEGFLPAEDFLTQLALGRGHTLFAAGQFAEAGRQFDELVARHPNVDAAPEARYWAGVSRYKANGDATSLGETARDLQQRYPQSTWAKKASVWTAS